MIEAHDTSFWLLGLLDMFYMRNLKLILLKLLLFPWVVKGSFALDEVKWRLQIKASTFTYHDHSYYFTRTSTWAPHVGYANMGFLCA